MTVSKSSVVSVRMPSTLIKELKELAQKMHFMDLSEEIRFILKKKMNEQKNPLSHEIQQLKDEIKTEISNKSQQDKARFVSELRGLLEEIKIEKGEDNEKL